MNKIFKVVYNHTLGRYVVTSEFSKARGKSKVCGKMIALALAATVVSAGGVAVQAATHTIPTAEQLKGNTVTDTWHGATIIGGESASYDNAEITNNKVTSEGVNGGAVFLSNNGTTSAASMTMNGV